MQGFLGQDIPPRGPWRGAAREKGEESPEREQIGQPTHICPETGRVSVCPAPPPARMGGGRKEAAHTADSTPARGPSCGCQSCLPPPEIWHGQCPQPSTHTPPSTVPLNQFYKSGGFNTVPSLHPALWTGNPLNTKPGNIACLKYKPVYLALY